MSKVSIVIPARNEPFLNKTIDEIYTKATGEIEVIAVLDGVIPEVLPKERPNLTLIKWETAKGMRPCINDGAAIATGKYLMKIDAHCALDEGFDEKLAEDCDEDWVVIPRRYSLADETWTPRRAPIDYMYLSFPDPEKIGDWGGSGYHGKLWQERNYDPDLKDVLIDGAMSFQGSCWFMHHNYFYYLELMDIERYGPFWQEAQEIGPKTWYAGGRVMRNKNTWYAHLHKGKKHGRGYFISKGSLSRAGVKTRAFIEDPVWDKKVRGLKSWVEAFWPIPTWPENWEELLLARSEFYKGA